MQHHEEVHVYFLLLKDKTHYCGITANLEQRLQQHTTERKSWASKVGINKFCFSIPFPSRSEAAAFEKKVKKIGVSRWISKNWPHYTSNFPF